MNTKTEIEELKRRHFGHMSEMLTKAGLTMPPTLSREQKLAGAAIEAKAAFDRGEVGEAHRILSDGWRIRSEFQGRPG